jgi:hypothetical protein
MLISKEKGLCGDRHYTLEQEPISLLLMSHTVIKMIHMHFKGKKLFLIDPKIILP